MRTAIVIIALAACCAAIPTAHAETFRPTRTDDPAPNGCLATDCSLREAVIAANASLAADTIDLKPTTYTLTRRVGGEAESYDLDILGTLTIRTTGFSARIDAAFASPTAQSRVIDVGRATLLLDRISLANGHVVDADGGCLRVATGGDVTIINGEVREGTALRGAGAAVTGSMLTMQSTYVGGNVGPALMLDDADLVLHGGIIANNQNLGRNGGGILVTGPGTSTLFAINWPTVSHNYAARGAGIFVVPGARLETDAVPGTALLLYGNWASAAGGGVHASGSTVVLHRVSFQNNHADSEGGAALLQSIDLADTTAKGNEAPTAAGFSTRCGTVGPCRFARANIMDNAATVEAGGILHAGTRALDIVNTEISGNSAPRGDNVLAKGNVSLLHVTSLAGGFYADSSLMLAPPAGGSATAVVANSVLYGGCVREGAGAVTSLGGNAQLADRPACGFDAASDLPMLPASEADPDGIWFGFGYYAVPKADSLLIGAGVAASCAPDDALGYTRTAPCDIGAIERDGVAP